MCDYTTELPMNIELDGVWEVGLVEVSFTRSWYNITSDQLVGVQDIQGRIYAKHPIKAGYYATEELVYLVNSLLSKHKIERLEDVSSSSEDIRNCLELSPDRGIRVQIVDTLIPETPKLNLNRNAHRADFELGITQHGAPVLPYLDDELAQLLGFPDHNEMRQRYYVEGLNANFVPATNSFAPIFRLSAKRSYDMDGGIAAIYIYSDIVKPQFIGDVKAPCLSVCLIPSNIDYSQRCSLSFPTPNYVPVSSKMFKTIRVSLKDKKNDFIPFEFGETIVKLHFRKKNAV